MRLKPVLKLRCFNQHFYLSGSWSGTRRSRTTRTRRGSTETNEFLGTPQIISTFLYLIGFRLFFLGPLLLQDQPAGLFLQQGQRNRLKIVRQMNDLEHFPHQVFSWMETCCACDAWDARDACDARDALNTRDACDARDANDPRDAKRCKD